MKKGNLDGINMINGIGGGSSRARDGRNGQDSVASGRGTDPSTARSAARSEEEAE
jgi:hypothetical protein